MARAETGVLQFGDDWPGVFIRGDNCFEFANALEAILSDKPVRPWDRAAVIELLHLLRSSNMGSEVFERPALVRSWADCAVPNKD